MKKNGFVKKGLLAVISALCFSFLLSACSISKQPSEEPVTTIESSDMTTSDAEKEAYQFMENLIRMLNNGDVDNYCDHYSKILIALNDEAFEDYKSDVRVLFKNSKSHDYEIISESYIPEEDYYEFLLGYTCLVNGEETYVECKLCVFNEADQLVCADSGLYKRYNEEMRTIRGITTPASEQTDTDAAAALSEKSNDVPEETQGTADLALQTRSFSGAATVNSGYASVEVTSNAGDRTITLKVTNHCGSSLSVYQQDQMIIYPDGRAENIDFFNNTSAGMLQVPAGSWGEVTYRLSDEQYNNMSGMKGMFFIQGFEGLEDNNYNLSVSDIQ